MMLEVFSVYDRGTKQYGTPMFLISEGQAMRSFSDEVNRADKDNIIGNHPDDFDLYHLGQFDTTTGSFAAVSPIMVITAKQLKL